MPRISPWLADSLLEAPLKWWREAKMWTVMYHSGLMASAVGLAAFVLWRIAAAWRERARLEALVASRTRQLSRSEELFRSIFEHASVGIFQSSLDGRNLRANAAMARVCGYASPEEMRSLLTDANTQFYVRPERRAEVNALVAREGEAIHCESEIRRKDGTTVWIAENVRTVVNPATGETVYQGSIEDITARREMQAAQERARAAAEAADRAKSAFLAHVTHELRTPLTGILSSARVALRDPALDTKHRERYALIATSGEHLLRLIEEVLDLSRIEAGRAALRPGPFDLAGLLRAVAGSLQAQAAEARLEFRCEADPGLPRHVHGDAQRLRQVLDNLLGNALKFTDRGRVTLGVRRGAGGAGRVGFEVEDTGAGIAGEHLETIFQPFRQAPPAPGRPAPPGVGLGLSISARLVELMGGRLRAESTPGRGSRFSFDLALPETDGGEVLAASPLPPGGPAVPGPAVAAPPPAAPSEAEIDALLTLSLAGDIVPLRRRLAALARDEPAFADFAGELDRLATGFRMDAIGEFLQRARRAGRPNP